LTAVRAAICISSLKLVQTVWHANKVAYILMSQVHQRPQAHDSRPIGPYSFSIILYICIWLRINFIVSSSQLPDTAKKLFPAENHVVAVPGTFAPAKKKC